jgi:cytochrome c6
MRRALALLLAVSLPVLVVACGGEEDKTTAPNTVVGTVPTETTGGGGAQGNAEAGAEVYTSAGCATCHTLSAAGSTGTTGPNLDEAMPSFEAAVAQITNGGGGMPPYKDQLSEQQIADVAAYVAENAGQ